MRTSPLHTLLESLGGLFAPYAPPAREGEPATEPIALCLTFDQLELEYAALRKSCALLDQPHRAVIEVLGPDRLEFLDRMLTQELKDLAPGQVRRSFWLNRKGRVDADLRVAHFEQRTLLELDAHTAHATLASLSSYVVMEDVHIRPLPAHRLALHGPGAHAALAHLLNSDATPAIPNLAAREGIDPTYNIIIIRDDTAGEPGLELLLPREHAGALADRLLALATPRGTPHAGAPAHAPSGAPALRLAGWHAYNIARIEAGSPLFLLDFGRDNLPAESGALDDRVSFTKGCYLGQEIVARLHARGTPKHRLVALRFDQNTDPGDPDARLLPESGSPLLPAPDAPEPVGAITSSTLSPMLAGTALAFAMVKSSHASPGTRLHARAEGHDLAGIVQTQLRFLPQPSAQTR